MSFASTVSPLAGSAVLFTAIRGAMGLVVVQVVQVPLLAVTVLLTEVVASASTVAV